MTIRITFELERETPLSLADAIINRENEMRGILNGDIAVENIRMIGEALVSYVEACNRIKVGDTE